MAKATRTFRIFVSSTFDDMRAERNALQADCFKRLRELCARHGTRFQAIDLRWGVPSEAGLDQRTMSICLEEIARCREVSPRPNFIVLLGDRYGWRPLPEEIEATQFEALLEVVGDPNDNRSLASRWYRRDDNAVPPFYRLRARTGEFEDHDAWSAVEARVRSALQAAGRRLDLSDGERAKYEASATEQEIQAGALKVDDASDHVFCFFRSIQGLPEDAAKYRDVHEGRADDEAAQRLAELKSKLKEVLPHSNVQDEYTSAWVGASGDAAGAPITLDHLAKMNEDVYESLRAVILSEIEQIEALDPLDREISDQLAFEEDRARFFTGRTSVLDAIDDYVRGTPRRPLVVHGVSGSGKSSVMARASIMSKERTVQPANPSDGVPRGAVVVSRYIGATPASSDIRSLLESLSREIARAYQNEEDQVPSEFQKLVEHLRERLEDATEDRPLVLFLDALDQLTDADGGRGLVWLPAELPDHVRVVVSTLPGDTFAPLKRRLETGAFLELEAMPTTEASALLDLWLIDAGRTLQPEQRRKVLEAFEGCPYPLYLKLAFEEARRWASYQPPAETNLESDIPGLIRQLFRRLSDPGNHGRLLTHHALGWLAAARNGLSEDEMLDLLSGSDERPSEVWESFRERTHHTPPERRLPVAVWSRFYLDLEPYLTERSADGTYLLSFYHRQLREVVEADMLVGPAAAARHADLARYFGQQPLFLDGREPPARDAARPSGIGVDHSRSANLRKLSELPFQQTRAAHLATEHLDDDHEAEGLWGALYETLTNFDFLEAKCSYVAISSEGTDGDRQTVYGGVYELQEDFRRALEVFPEGLDTPAITLETGP